MREIEEIAEKIKAIRKEKGLTAREVCFRSMLGSTQFRKIEKGSNTSVKTLNKIAKALGVHITDLMPSKEEEAA